MPATHSRLSQHWTPLMYFYAVCAAVGAVVPWYFNIQFMREEGGTFSVQRFLAAGFATNGASSLTSDGLIAATAMLVWMLVEGRRLEMRHLWVYVVCTFLIAIAFACPLFLLQREFQLQRLATTKP